MKFALREWRQRRVGSLHGHATVVFDGYLEVSGIAILTGKNGLWVAMPTRDWSDNSGKKHYDRLIEFVDREAADRFADALIARVRELHPDCLAA